MSGLNEKKANKKRLRRVRAHRRLRQRLVGTPDRPRLSVFKSAKYVYAQVIDDEQGRTLAAAASLEPALKERLEGCGNLAAAKMVGETVAERALANGVKSVVFDRGGYRYHGKVKELADAARAKGLEF
jgi:large subunit ribosomal protein L18